LNQRFALIGRQPRVVVSRRGVGRELQQQVPVGQPQRAAAQGEPGLGPTLPGQQRRLALPQLERCPDPLDLGPGVRLVGQRRGLVQQPERRGEAVVGAGAGRLVQQLPTAGDPGGQPTAAQEAIDAVRIGPGRLGQHGFPGRVAEALQMLPGRGLGQAVERPVPGLREPELRRQVTGLERQASSEAVRRRGGLGGRQQFQPAVVERLILAPGVAIRSGCAVGFEERLPQRLDPDDANPGRGREGLGSHHFASVLQGHHEGAVAMVERGAELVRHARNGVHPAELVDRSGEHDGRQGGGVA